MTDKPRLASEVPCSAREPARAVLIDLSQIATAEAGEFEAMSWVDCMTLRRRADQVRMLGWFNLAITLIVASFHVSEGVEVLLAALAWAGCIMAVSYAAASRIDRRAERLVAR
jgi:hypothetical protein